MTSLEASERIALYAKAIPKEVSLHSEMLLLAEVLKAYGETPVPEDVLKRLPKDALEMTPETMEKLRRGPQSTWG